MHIDRRHVLVGLCLLVLCHSDRAFSQQDGPLGEDNNLFVTAAKDLGHLATSPLRMKKADGLRLLAFSGLAAGLMLGLDERVDEEYGIEGSNAPLGIPGAAARIGEFYDSSGIQYFVLSSVGAFLVSGLVLDDSKLIKTSGLVAESFLFAKLFTSLGKWSFGRSRPFTGDGPRKFRLLDFSSKSARRSLPSGHTSSAFAVMTVIARQYSAWWVKVPAYGFATSVAFQRIDSRHHWTSDVLVGGALGYLVGSALVRRHANDGTSGTSVIPPVFLNQAGTTLRFHF